jgi:Rrf2 family iron-sulfur cluster assembly transcriptional regulator
MAMADLAMHQGDERPVPLQDIAARQAISLSYLEQLFSRLRRSGLVTSVRGPGGGYRLARTAGQTSIAEIVVAVNEAIGPGGCEDGAIEDCSDTGRRCVAHDLWEALGRNIEDFLSSVSLQDVLSGRIPRAVPVAVERRQEAA